MKKGLVPFFGPIYQIVFTVIVISFVFMCVNTLVSSSNIYYEFLAIEDTLESACTDGIAAGPGPDLPRGFFMIQLNGDTIGNCYNIIEFLDDEGKFRAESSCSYQNCLGSFCLCMGRNPDTVGFPTHDMSTSGTPNPNGILLSAARNDRETACDDLSNTNLYDINLNSMCCIRIPTDCSAAPVPFITMVQDSGYVVFDGIYAKEGDIAITSINFQMAESDSGQMLEILKT